MRAMQGCSLQPSNRPLEQLDEANAVLTSLVMQMLVGCVPAVRLEIGPPRNRDIDRRALSCHNKIKRDRSELKSFADDNRTSACCRRQRHQHVPRAARVSRYEAILFTPMQRHKSQTVLTQSRWNIRLLLETLFQKIECLAMRAVDLLCIPALQTVFAAFNA